MAPETDPGSLTPSLVRTVVPFVVGSIASWLLTRGIDMDEASKAQLTSVVTVVLGAAYYAVVRLGERVRPKLGVLLGMAKAPVYDTAPIEARAVAAEVSAQAVEARLENVVADRDSLAAEAEALRLKVADLEAEVVRPAPAKKAPAKKAAAKKAPVKKAAPRRPAGGDA